MFERQVCSSAALAIMTVWALAGHVLADEAAIVEKIIQFFATTDTPARVRLAEQIAADPTFDRDKLSDWLHAAGLFGPQRAGKQAIDVPLHNGKTRSVHLRIPEGYDQRRPWPLLYVMHGSGGRAGQILGYYERILGDRVDEFVLAAPDQYADLIVHQPEWPPTGEHPAVWRRLREIVHIDSDRMFVSGYSLGGHTTWTLAVLHPDQFAGAMPLASTFTLLLPDLLWEHLVPNLEHLPVLCVWGENDKFYGGERISPEGGIAGVNRELKKLLAEHDIPVTMIELPGVGHGGVTPPADELAKLLDRQRVHWPASFTHVFRHIYQGPCYWIEPHVWHGKQWTSNQEQIQLRPGENPLDQRDFDQAVARTYRGLLAETRGEIQGQTLRVYRKRIRELTVWVGDGMLDWQQPVQIVANGRKVFDERLEPSVFVALSQSARTRDFDRLRWAGVYLSRGKPKVVGERTEFPDPFGQ